MIAVRSCSFRYPGGAAVLQDISFDVPRGTLFLVAGCNGSGKSTLLQLLAGLLEPNSGSIAVDGATKARELRARASLCLQEPDLQILGATAREDLALCLPRGADFAPAMSMAARLRLEQSLDAPVQILSHGQKRKLCLATALLTQERRGAGRPALLLLDEPCSGLDYPALLELREILRENKRLGVTQLVVSHDLEPLADLAEGLGLIQEGCMRHVGPPTEVLRHARDCGVRPPCAWREGDPLPEWR